jgi:hypothetical protein
MVTVCSWTPAVLDALLAGDVDGGRGAEGVREGDQGEPEAAGGAGEGQAVLRRRRRGLPRRRRQRVRALASGLRGGRGRQPGHGRGVPGPVPVGEGVSGCVPWLKCLPLYNLDYQRDHISELYNLVVAILQPRLLKLRLLLSLSM